MSRPLIVDTHMHLYRSAEEVAAAKVGYQIWEYGEREDVHFSNRSGDLASAIDGMEVADCRVAVVTNLHDVPRPGVPVQDDLVAFNRWLCGVARDDPRFYPLIAVDPNVMSVAENVAHLEQMARDEGARGIKLHPPVQRLDFADRSLWPIFETCRRLDLVIVSHSGPSSDGSGRGTPESFRPVLDAFPGLRLVLAHMGGQSWRQLPAIARDYPWVHFDLCEIVEWLGASLAPTQEEFVGLVREVGPGKVMMGSDFPWYDIDHTVDLVHDLPGLTVAEKHALLGENAARFFRLSV